MSMDMFEQVFETSLWCEEESGIAKEQFGFVLIVSVKQGHVRAS